MAASLREPQADRGKDGVSARAVLLHLVFRPLDSRRMSLAILISETASLLRAPETFTIAAARLDLELAPAASNGTSADVRCSQSATRFSPGALETTETWRAAMAAVRPRPLR